MATLRDIKRRINAVKNTKQITKAMKMVAASKLRKAQTRMLEMRAYADKMNSVIAGLSGESEGLHPLLTVRSKKTVEVIVMTSDRGLCGAFNSNILKTAAKFIAELKQKGFNVSLNAVGKKAFDYFKRRNVPMRKTWTGLSGKGIYSDVQKVAVDVIDNYINETIDEVFLIYNEFKTVMAQKVTTAKLLPVAPIELSREKAEMPASFIYEPSRENILNQLLPKNIEVQVYRSILESQASEEAARMTAMENATQNADEMIGKLTLQYNKARQANITKELMDIVGGVEALK
ncbi:MAG: ATP synthase F1 subunit gamma [Nitrospirae bacterium]|nr:ATP synthase F1 subunit gamma [Nitrospirota bacterium]